MKDLVAVVEIFRDLVWLSRLLLEIVLNLSLEGPGTTGPVDFDFCLLEVLGTFAAEAPLAGDFLFLLGGLILSDLKMIEN